MGLNDVTRWAPTVRELRTAAGLTARDYPTTLVLAQIGAESGGDPQAISPGGEHYGLLQIGELAANECGRDSGSYYLGRGRESIECYYQRQERYSHLHQHNPYWVATLWKAGPGTLQTYYELASKPGDWQALARAHGEHGSVEWKGKWGTLAYLWNVYQWGREIYQALQDPRV